MSRPQIVKHLWEYIRANNLQNPAKKSDIINDDLFKEIFGVEKMTMFSMNKVGLRIRTVRIRELADVIEQYLKKAVSPIEG
jgi:chromatin remodeling complex protein RSC6